jgi:hypothetical protein
LSATNSGTLSPSRRYQRSTDSGAVRFCPGNGYFREIMARWETVVMPFEREYLLADSGLGEEDLSGAASPTPISPARISKRLLPQMPTCAEPVWTTRCSRKQICLSPT